MRRMFLMQLSLLMGAAALFSGLLCLGSILIVGMCLLNLIGVDSFGFGEDSGVVAIAFIVCAVVFRLLCKLFFWISGLLGDKAETFSSGSKKIEVHYMGGNKWYSSTEGGKTRDLTCRDCKYHATRLDDDKPYCSYHEFLFEGNYETCEHFSYNGPTATVGRGCLLWILEFAAFVVIAVLIGVFSKEGLANLPGGTPASDTKETELLVEETTDNMDNAQSYQDSGFIFPRSDTELIDQQEAKDLSDSDLVYAINEIYARHGYIFRSDELRGYYEQFSWYTGKISADEFSVDCFNQIEQQNWNLLVNERNRRKSSD